MDTITEIETAIEQLPTPKVEELAAWLEAHRARRAAVRKRQATANSSQSFPTQFPAVLWKMACPHGDTNSPH